MTTKKTVVGPVDVAAYLAAIRAGKVKPLPPAEVDVILDAAVAVEYSALCDRFNTLVARSAEEAKLEQSIAGEATGDYAAELDSLEAQIDALDAEANLKGRFAFRGYEAGDSAMVQAIVKELPEAERTQETATLIEVALYSVDANPKKLAADNDGRANIIAMGKLSVDDVKAIIPVIGYTQWQRLKSTYEAHVYGVPTAPKLRKPSPTRGTATR